MLLRVIKECMFSNVHIYNADGRVINEIVTIDEKAHVVLKDGYSIDSNHSYDIKKSDGR